MNEVGAAKPILFGPFSATIPGSVPWAGSKVSGTEEAAAGTGKTIPRSSGASDAGTGEAKASVRRKRRSARRRSFRR